MFDDVEVINGDFVSKNPDIKIVLSDDSPVPITDPNLVKVYLNVEEVIRDRNYLILHSSINPKFVTDQI